MKRNDVLNGLCIIVALTLLPHKYDGNQQEQLMYLYFFSAAALLIFYRARMS
jgi:hypothetical protein